MRTALVTGGAGFIGSHLVERLVAANYRVRIIDSLVSGRRENLAKVMTSDETADQVELHELDIRDFEAIAPLFAGVDSVFHLAGLADIVPSIEEPLAYLSTNVLGTAHVLEAARQAGVRRFVYAASSSCYGLAEELPTSESAPITPRYPYALTKFQGEQLVLHYAQVYGLGAVSLRLFNVYGPRSRTAGTYGAVFGVFLAQKLAKVPYTVVGDGLQSRDFTFVSDVVRAFQLAAESELAGEVVNIGTGQPQSILRLVKLLGGELSFIPKRPGEPDCTCANTAKARRLLGFEPKVSFEQGVQIMLEHLADFRSAPVWDREGVAAATASWFRYLK